MNHIYYRDVMSVNMILFVTFRFIHAPYFEEQGNG